MPSTSKDDAGRQTNGVLCEQTVETVSNKAENTNEDDNVSSDQMKPVDTLNSTGTTELMNDSQVSSMSCLSYVESLADNVNLCEMDVNPTVFKAPLKREKRAKEEVLKQARKEFDKMDDFESESDETVSECSQNEWKCNDYGTDDVKKFLKLTKKSKGSSSGRILSRSETLCG